MTDLEQKRRYDQDRQKAGYNNLYPNLGKQTGPPRAATTNVPPPPPPRRGGTAQTAKPTFATPGSNKPPPSAGAQRYAGWARASAQEWQQAKEEAQARADAFPGFSGMRSGPNTNAQGPPPQRGYRPRFVPTAQRPASSYVPPPTFEGPKHSQTWDQSQTSQAGFPGMSRTQTSRKRAGFDPSTPSGDEHMAGSSAYANVHREGQAQAPQPEQSYFDVRKPQMASDDFQSKSAASPLRHTRSQEDPPTRPGISRQSTKYAGKPKERTDLFGPGLGRSASVRTSPIDARYEDHASQRPHSHHGAARFRSASPGLRSPMAEAQYSSESSSSSSSEEEVLVRPRTKVTPRQRVNRTGAMPNYGGPNGQSANEAYAHETNSPQQDHTASYQYPPPPPRNQPFFPDAKGTHDANEHRDVPANGQSLYDHPSFSYTHKWSQDWGFSPRKGTQPFPSKDPPYWALPSSISPETLRYKTRNASGLPTLLEEFEESIESLEQKHSSSASNNFPLPSTESSKTSANINNVHSSASATAAKAGLGNLPKAFNSSEWDGKFDSLSFAPSANHDRRSPTRGSRRASTQPHTRTASPGKDDTPTGTDGTSTTSTTKTAFQPAKFDADKWKEQFGKDHTWTNPSSEGPRGKTPRKASRAAPKKASHSKPPPNATAEEIKESAADPAPNGASQGRSAAAATAAVVDEMDLDSPGVPTPPDDAAHSNVSVNNQPPPQDTSASVNLDDLGSVHPFKPSNTGLGDLEDLTSTLPFQSRPAPSVDLNESASSTLKTITDLKLPRPPKSPIAPMEESLSPGRWISYITSMSAYMKEWSNFNKQILEHFQIRQARMDHNMASNWIGSIGDGPTDLAAELEKGSGVQAGYKTYMSWVEQDTAVREWWNVACERHREAMMELGRVRERMKKSNERAS